MDFIKKSWRALLISFLLVGATLAAFWPVAHHDFVKFDDPDYVSRNAMVQRGLTWDGVAWAFKTVHASNWHPLTWLSHMLDAQLCGVNPGCHHLNNLLFHAANVLLLFFVFVRLTGALWRSGFVAGLFALHPLHVESVAWLSERKDVLSGFFFMLTLLAYTKYVGSVGGRGSAEKSVVNRHWSLVWFCATLLLFAMGLMSKPMLVTLPFVLLLLDYWPLNRFELKTQNSKLRTLLLFVREKVPFFALSAASSILTVIAQKSGGSVASLQYVSLSARISNALMAYVAYLQKMFWPSKLVILYLRPERWEVWQIAFATTVLLAITAVVALFGRKPGWLTVGWLWYLGMLVPVIGLVQVGNQFMADRYTYLPLIGIFIIVSWGGWEWMRTNQFCRAVWIALAFALLCSLAVATQRQVQFWKNTETLFGHCLKIAPDNYIAHNILGAALGPQGRFEEAREQFLAALRIHPDYAEGLNNLGILLTEHGDFDEAARYLQEAAQRKPELGGTYGKLAFVLDANGNTTQAIAYYRECLRFQPDNVEACNDLAWLLAASPDSKLRNGNEAVGLAEHACELSGYRNPILIGTLAAAYAEAGRFQDAVGTAEKAIALATASGQKEIAQRNRELLELYRQGQAYHESKAR